jgi:5-formyltetrahydrofolate cyclo-ligase
MLLCVHLPLPILGYGQFRRAGYDNGSCFLLLKADIRQHICLKAKHAPGRAREDAAQLIMMDVRDPLHEKHRLRAAAHLHRLHQPDRLALSERIFDRVVALPQYAAAGCLLGYVSFRSEVSTHEFLAKALRDGKQVAVPYCVDRHLELFRLNGFEDLAPGTLGILEPRWELRSLGERRVPVESIDLFVIPGLAFDRGGGRLGYGKGYFDGLLTHARPDALLAAVAFECQLFDAIPMLSHDVRVDAVVTESGTFRRTLPRSG